MATVRASWLEQGYFVLRNDGLMREVRDILEKSLGQAKGSMSIHMAPEPNKWKHICWWREGRKAYAEAQFFAQIPRGYPILALGLAVEKGFRSSDESQPRVKRMDSRWDWHRLVADSETILDRDVRRLAIRLKRPVTLRIKCKTANAQAWGLDAFSCVNGQWHHRYEGHTDAERITRQLRKIHANRDQWAIVHLACDLSPEEADGLTATKIAGTLMRFNEIRKRLRGSAVRR